jgi:glycosyltransferase involved in cell wall biosynthesis
MQPLVSILLPLYNEPIEMAEESINSILSQTYNNLEIILLLDNPLNSELCCYLKKVAKDDNRVKCQFNHENIGLPSTLNTGIDLSTGQYIARMDADDIAFPERIEKQLKILQKNPDIHLIGSDTTVIDDNGNTIGYYSRLKSDRSQKTILENYSIELIHPTWMGHASLFKICRYRNFRYCEYYDFMLRAYAMGYNFFNIQEPLLKYRIQNSISRKYAYEQYINMKIAHSLFVKYCKNNKSRYPEIPNIEYDVKDKEKYLATIPLLNELRKAFFKKNIIKSIVLIGKIVIKDKRPILYRIKVNYRRCILHIRENLKNMVLPF